MLLAVKDGKNGKQYLAQGPNKTCFPSSHIVLGIDGKNWGGEGVAMRTTQPLPRAPSWVAPSVVVVVAARLRRPTIEITAYHHRRIVVETEIVLAADRHRAKIDRRRRHRRLC